LTALYIVLGVIAVILLLLLIPIRLSLVFKDRLSLTLSYLFFRFPLYPNEKRVKPSDYTPRKLRKKKRKLRKKRLIEKAAAAHKAKKPKMTLEKRLRQLRLILSVLKGVYENILSAVHLRVKRLFVTVATDDAAKTAILYGVAAQSTSYLLALLSSYTKTTVKSGDADVIADFCGTESTLDASLVFWATPLSLLCLGIRAAFLFLKQKQLDKNKKRSKQI
jgi:hypothetical protein